MKHYFRISVLRVLLLILSVILLVCKVSDPNDSTQIYFRCDNDTVYKGYYESELYSDRPANMDRFIELNK